MVSRSPRSPRRPGRPLGLGRRDTVFTSNRGLGSLGRRNRSWDAGWGRSGPWDRGGFSSWSQRRKMRLARTIGIALLIVIVLWRCTAGGGDTATTSTTQPPATVASTAPPPIAATTATARALRQPLPEQRSLGGGARAGDSLIVAGGLDVTRTSTTSIWRLDPRRGGATEVGQLPRPLHGPAMAPLGRSALLIGGGMGSDIYDHVLAIGPNGGVRERGRLPTRRSNATAVASPDGGSVIVAGGYTGLEPTNEVLQTTDGVTFTTVGTLLHPVRFPAVAMLGRSVWVIGGEYDKALTTFVQRLDLDTGQVTDVAALPVALSRAAAFTLGGSIFVAGGRTVEGRSDQIYRIDPTTGLVAAAGALPEGRSDATLVVDGERVFLVGGMAPNASDTVVVITAN